MFSLVVTIILILILTPLIQRWIRWRKFVKTIDKIPGYKKHFLLGNAGIGMKVDRLDMFDVLIRKRHEDFPGGISRNWLFNLAEVRLNKPEYVEKILSSSVNIQKAIGYELEVKKWLGQGLITSSGEYWRAHRKIITPAFHFSILEGFCDTFTEKVDIMVKKLEKYSENGEIVDVLPFINLAALDIICETAMGIKMNAQETGESEYIDAVGELAHLALRRLLNPILHNEFIFNLTSTGKRAKKVLKTLHDFTDKVIIERKALRENRADKGTEYVESDKKMRLAFLDLLLAEAEKTPYFTDKDIREEVDTFVFAGHDTTTVSTAWALFLLGHHPEVQEQLFEEQREIFEDSDRLPSYADLTKMSYMDRVMKECIRVYPTIFSVSRRLIEDIQVDGYLIPAGTTVGIGIWGVSRDERYFPDPEKFDPDRWLPENSQNRHPYAHIPFSAGPRNCIGQKFAQLEEKTMLSIFIRKYKFKSIDSRKDVKIIAELVARPYPGIRLKLEKRQ